jgi:hypothetical protein
MEQGRDGCATPALVPGSVSFSQAKKFPSSQSSTEFHSFPWISTIPVDFANGRQQA